MGPCKQKKRALYGEEVSALWEKHALPETCETFKKDIAVAMQMTTQELSAELAKKTKSVQDECAKENQDLHVKLAEAEVKLILLENCPADQDLRNYRSMQGS